MFARQCLFSLVVACAFIFTSICHASDNTSGGPKDSIPDNSATISDFTGTNQDQNETGGNVFMKAASQTPVADINPSRTSCTAPCGILFEGTGSMNERRR